MKKVVKEQKELKIVNLDEVSEDKIYAFRGGGCVKKIHQVSGGKWSFIFMSYSCGRGDTIKTTLVQYIEDLMTAFIIYEFKDEDDFFDNARNMEESYK